MKTLLAILTLLALCLTTSATMYRGPNGYRKDSLPTSIKGVRQNIPASYWLDSGEYWVETAQELADHEQTEADAIAEAELYADTQPAVFVPRFSGALTNVVGLSQIFVDDDTGEFVEVDETGSPEHTKAQKQAQRDAKKAATANGITDLASALENEPSTKKQWDIFIRYLRTKEGIEETP